MATQTIALPSSAYIYTSAAIQWNVSGTGGAPAPIQIDSSLAPPGTTRYLNNFAVFKSGRILLDIQATTTTATSGADLSNQFESDGEIMITTEHGSLLVKMGSDTSDPYIWTPSNPAEVTAFYNAHSRTAVPATLFLDDNPAAAGDGDAITGKGALGEAEGASIVIQREGHADGLSATGAVGEAEGAAVVIVRAGDADGVSGKGSVGEAEGESETIVIAGEGDTITGRGAVGEAEGQTADVISGDGSTITGKGAVGEAQGFTTPPVAGDGSAITGRGAVGEAEGEPETVVVSGAGSAITGKGALGEAEGVPKPPIAGDGSAITGRGAVGEAEGATRAPFAGDGAPIRGRGSIREAEGAIYVAFYEYGVRVQLTETLYTPWIDLPNGLLTPSILDPSFFTNGVLNKVLQFRVRHGGDANKLNRVWDLLTLHPPTDEDIPDIEKPMIFSAGRRQDISDVSEYVVEINWNMLPPSNLRFNTTPQLHIALIGEDDAAIYTHSCPITENIPMFATAVFHSSTAVDALAILVSHNLTPVGWAGSARDPQDTGQYTWDTGWTEKVVLQ